jgi:hypothetical protein
VTLGISLGWDLIDPCRGQKRMRYEKEVVVCHDFGTRGEVPCDVRSNMVACRVDSLSVECVAKRGDDGVRRPSVCGTVNGNARSITERRVEVYEDDSYKLAKS